jgi:ribonuclease HII
MHRAIEQLVPFPGLLLIDGNRFKPYADIPHVCLIKGDGRFQSIAAASILAKTHRDALMLSASTAHPEYGWKTNKGYPTPEHFDAIAKLGITPFHRKSFRLSRQLALFKA